ncbi:MAG: hypothetical protein ACYC5U_12675, partial [Rhodocyclaceae bacterium]
MSSWRGWNWDDGNFGGSGLEPQAGRPSPEHIENVLNRLKSAPATPTVDTVLTLSETPVADPQR